MGLVLLLACEPGVLHGVVATPNARIPTSIEVNWDLFSPAGSTFVEYGLDPEVLDRSTPAGAGPAATVLGLTAGNTWFLRAVTVDSLGERWASEVISVDVEPAPAALPRLTVSDADPAAFDPDSVVFTTLLMEDAGWIVGLDRAGDYVWWLEAEDGLDVPSIHLDAAGTGLIFPRQAKVGDQTGNGVIDVSFSGKTYELIIAPEGHHDAIQLPDTNVAWIEGETRDDVLMDSGASHSIAYDTIYETTARATTADGAMARFNTLDDYPHVPWRMCAHFDEEGPGGGSDYTHANSLMYDGDHDAFLMMSKNLDALLSIDRQTGAVNWQAGGRYSDFVDVAGDPTNTSADDVDGPNLTWWSHGHMSHAWPKGFLVFDNGYHHTPPASRVVEYRFDAEAGTLEKVWELPSDPSAFNPLLGDARRLENGNTLVSWTLQGLLTEVTPERRVVWRASADLGAATGRVLALPSLYGGD